MKRLQKVAVRVSESFFIRRRDAPWVALLMVTGGGSGGNRHPCREKSPESRSGGCGVNGGGSILPQSSPRPKFLLFVICVFS
ncbi:unnamed protein product [Brassica oleracea var. botrytis]